MEELRWSAPAHEYHEKGFFWETGVIIIAAILIIVALFVQQNFLFAVFVIIAAGTIIFWSRQQPATIEFMLSQRGLAINGENRYPFIDLQEFSVSPHEVTKDGHFEVVFHKKSALGTHLKVPVKADQAGDIKAFLANYLPEFEYEESVTDHLSRIFRF